MKKIKFVISFILILIGFFITGESYQLYLDNFETQNYSTTLFLNGSPNNTEQKMVEDIKKAAEQNDVQVFTVVSDVKSMLLSERRIYGTVGTEKYIRDHFQIKGKSYPSILSGTKNIVFHSLEQLVQNEDLTSITQYYLIGAKDAVFNFKDSLNGVYAGNFPQEGYDSSGKVTIFSIWLLISFVLLFLSYYDVTLQKKESFIRISLGERTSVVMFKNIALDTIVYSLVFFGTFFTVRYYTSTFFHFDISFVVFMSMLFFNALLYLTFYFYNIKEAMADTKSSKKLLVMNYGLKIFSVMITLTVVSSNIAVIVESLQFYQQRAFFKEHADYFYVKLQYRLTPEQSEDNSLEDSFLVTETFYRKFFKDFDATQLVTSGVLGNNVMLANQNSLPYLQDHIEELSMINSQKELYFILPEDLKNDKNLISQLKNNVELVEQTKFDYDYDIIFYKGNPKIICIDEFSINGSYYMKLPIIVYNNMDLTNRVDLANASHFRWDYAHDILYKISPDQLDSFVAEHNSETNELHYQLTNVLEKYEYQWSIIKRTLYLNVILTLLILFLEFIIITTILRLEYKVNAIELSIKKVLGHTVWQKNRKILLITVIPTLLGIAAASILRLFTDAEHFYDYLIYGSLLILAIEPFIILSYIRKLERANIQKILKGGSL
ncbi:hypothetical protein [Paenibacillus aquistagni]|uniref:Bacteriocin-associated integral membrane (Putative immunity) protein n=1 Tax=Paenibacillus aquistagni TaxID=1852522 RepID=A0A1X7I0T0_9BACL|nr:hypothetical protein [Paenibacillus aquistagni]SMG07993.1 hypothetical protein SAMN06295960_0036 [Paenibacillus aquistagni]